MEVLDFLYPSDSAPSLDLDKIMTTKSAIDLFSKI